MGQVQRWKRIEFDFVNVSRWTPDSRRDAANGAASADS
jgi:hypothetical protein